ncbi:PspC domain-containing protein [Aquirufa sp. 2-AUSEE-184A6]|uniref:PspC domain-containing protein n=1 Tax=Aquirufa novilacunae TaxID=3139305 RepID=A0ABW8SV48_9BACT
MKKTLSINIAGFVFHIEEDAYATLDAYLKSIHAYFASFEGSKEIIADIESSIAEKFWNIRETEKTEAISQAHVDALIASLGTIADFKQVEEEEDKKEGYTAPKSEEGPKVFRRDITRKKLGGVAAGIARYFQIDPIWVRLVLLALLSASFPLFHLGNIIFWAYIILWAAIPGELNPDDDKSYRKFYRDPEKKVIGGVMAGIAAYTGWDVGLLRVIAVLSVGLFGSGVIAYLVILAITPEAKTMKDKMEMTGEPITLENIENNIKKSIQPNETEENALTKVLLFPFRIAATVFGALKGPLNIIRWVVQIFVGIILLILGIAFIVALVGICLFGFTGIDQGQFVHMGPLPLYLISKDLPIWAIPALVLAFLPVFVSIAIAGASLLANRKFYNKTYKIASTTMMIVGWVGLFAAAAFYGRNFQRSASYNQVKDIAVSDSTTYVLDIDKKDNETIWQMMLGEKVEELGFEFEDDEDNHDYNEERFNRANIEIEGYDGKTIQVIQYAKSQGLTRKEAESNAKKIKYNYLQKGKDLRFDTHFGLSDARFRAQRLKVKIMIPYGKSFSMTRDFAYYMDNVLEGGYFHEEGQDLFIGSLWTFSADKGLICLNRVPHTDEESKDEDFSDEKVGFTITKDLQNFTSIQGLNTESSQIKITRGDLHKITYKGNQALESSVHVENNVLIVDKIQPGIQVEIVVPELTKVELGGNASTEIEGFTSSTFDVVLRGFHSLTLKGGGDQLNAALFDSAELVAPDFAVSKAYVTLDKYAKIEVNASKYVQGKKYDSSSFVNKASAGVSYKWNVIK